MINRTVLLSFTLLFFFSASLSFAQEGGLEYLLKAEELKKNNNLKGAIDEYNKAIAADPTNPEYVFRKGKTYIILKDADNAIQCFEKTVELRRDYLDAHTRLAKLYALKNKTNEAIAAFDNAFKYESNPKDKIDYKLNIIKLFYRDGRFQEAGQHINDALAIDGNNVNALYYNAKYNNQIKKYDVAVSSMQKATSSITSTDPRDFAKLYFELGYAYYYLGKYNDANNAFAKANYGPYKPKIFEMTSVYFHSLATAYFKVYELPEANAMLEQALKIKSDFSAAHELLVKITSLKTDQSAVIKQMKVSSEQEKDPVKKGNILSTIAQKEFESGLYADAINSANACLAIQSTNYMVNFYKILSLARTEKINDAIAQLNELLKYNGLDQETKAQFNFALGLLYNKAGNTKMANTSFKKSEFGSFKYASVAELRKNNDESQRQPDPGENEPLSEKNDDN